MEHGQGKLSKPGAAIAAWSDIGLLQASEANPQPHLAGMGRHIRSLVYHFPCNMSQPNDPEGLKLFGTGGQLLKGLKELMLRLTDLHTLKLVDFVLERFEANHLLDEVVCSCCTKMRVLNLVNVTTTHCAIMHVGLFLNLQVSGQSQQTRTIVTHYLWPYLPPGAYYFAAEHRRRCAIAAGGYQAATPTLAAELLYAQSPDHQCLRRQSVAQSEGHKSAAARPFAHGEPRGRRGGAAARGTGPQHHLQCTAGTYTPRAADPHGGPLQEQPHGLWPRAAAALYQP